MPLSPEAFFHRWRWALLFRVSRGEGFRMSKGVEPEFASSWKIEDAVETYGISQWGKDYFGINAAGHVTVHPNKRSGGGPAIDLKELVDQLQARGIQLPILLRFTDILRHRVGEIHDA